MTEEKLDLKKVHTCQLVEELTSREGVDSITVEPYKTAVTKIEGPAMILIVID
jgi:hypothetical protein